MNEYLLLLCLHWLALISLPLECLSCVLLLRTFSLLDRLIPCFSIHPDVGSFCSISTWYTGLLLIQNQRSSAWFTSCLVRWLQVRACLVYYVPVRLFLQISFYQTAVWLGTSVSEQCSESDEEPCVHWQLWSDNEQHALITVCMSWAVSNKWLVMWWSYIYCLV